LTNPRLNPNKVIPFSAGSQKEQSGRKAKGGCERKGFVGTKRKNGGKKIG